MTSDEETEGLLQAFEALGSPTRIALLQRLAEPAFMADLVRDLGVTRQTLARHLDVLSAAGLVRAVESQRGFLKAHRYAVDPAGLFSFKEAVQALALAPAPPEGAGPATLPRGESAREGAPEGSGLLLLHGDRPGRWFPLGEGASAVIGRDAAAEVSLPYDAYASARHAHLLRARGAWALKDLDSRNGTFVNFRRVERGGSARVRHGDVITVGRSQLLLRSGA